MTLILTLALDPDPDLQVGDHVVPCYTPQCAEWSCIFCQSPKTNLCPKIRGTQGVGVMPDGTTRFKNMKGEEIFHFMGTSTFSEYTVVAEISCAKIAPEAVAPAAENAGEKENAPNGCPQQ